MDWSPSVSVDDSEAFATTSDSNNGLIDIYCSQQRRDMLHRIRMQTFMRPLMTGYLQHHNHFHQQQEQQQQQQQQQQSITFEQEMSEPQSQGYDWGQESSLNSTQMNTALSFDMLLSMGSPQSSVSAAPSLPGASSSPVLAEAQQGLHSFAQPQQLHHLSSIPLVPFTSEYSVSSSGSSDDPFRHQSQLSHHPTSISLSSIPTSPSTPTLSQAVVAALPHQSYYELLMAANPNEPLSQLLSTNATSMTSASFTVTSSATTALSIGPSSAYAVLDASVPASLAVSVNAPEQSSMEVPRTEQLLSSAASSFAISNLPGASGLSTHSPQQTIPLTTKEIMDALSGQFPIQPVTPSISEMSTGKSVAEPVLSDQLQVCKSAVPSTTLVLLPIYSTVSMRNSQSIHPSTPLVEAVENSNTSVVDSAGESTTLCSGNKLETVKASADLSTAGSQQTQEEPWDSDCHMLSPPSNHKHDEDDGDTSAVIDSTFESQGIAQEASIVALVDLADISLLSPPSSPSKSNIRSPKRTKSSPTNRRSSRAQTRRSRSKSEAGSFTSSLGTIASNAEDDQDNAIRTTKRRRSSDEDVSSCSSPESSPPSPRTPPALLDSHCTIHQQSIREHEASPDQEIEQRQGKVFELDSKRPKTQIEDNPTMGKNTDCSGNTIVANVDDFNSQIPERSQVDAGILSPSLLARYPTRQSTRILRRTSGKLQSITSCGVNTHHHHVNGGKPALLTNTSKATAA
ncbi:hypothetical protein BGX27_010594 [Mortierella sp. AM989]|nr:hypothetical protein BGX27_010594 [Mortierella sp. AM989]